MNTQTIRRVFIFEPCLGSMTGHWESNCRRFSDEFKRRGLSVSIFCQKDPSPAIQSTFNIIPTFTTHPFHDITTTDAFQEQYAIFLNDFNQIDKTQFKSGDLLLFPTVLPHTHKAAMEWMSDFISADGPQAAFIFMIAAGEFPAAFNTRRYRLLQKISSIGYFHNLLLKPLYRWKHSPYIQHYQSYIHHFKQKTEKSGYYFFGGCDEFSMNFRWIFQVPVRTLPFQAEIYQPQNGIDHTSNEIKIGYFGHASLEKGAQFLKYIVEKIHQKHPKVRFILHVNPNIHTKEILAYFQQPLPNVTCYHGHIDYSQLNELMHTVDINILAYAPAKYAGMPSMVFSEAVCAKNILVVPNYTWLSRESKKIQAAHVTFNHYNQVSVTKAILKAIQKIKHLKTKTNSAKNNFIKKHHLSNYIEQIIDTAEGKRGEPNGASTFS